MFMAFICTYCKHIRFNLLTNVWHACCNIFWFTKNEVYRIVGFSRIELVIKRVQKRIFFILALNKKNNYSSKVLSIILGDHPYLMEYQTLTVTLVDKWFKCKINSPYDESSPHPRDCKYWLIRARFTSWLYSSRVFTLFTYCNDH